MDTCEFDIDKVERGPSYWKLNSPFLVIEEHTDLIKLIIHIALTGAIINNKYSYDIKQGMKY